MFRQAIVGIVAVAAAGMMFAQDPAPQGIVVQRFGGAIGAVPPGGANVSFIAAEMAFEGKTVTGAPYSAEAVTETTQTLSDGNRISQTTQGVVARDSEGRTRREQAMPALPGAQGSPMKLVFINDPVAQVNYVLHPDRTADKMPLMKGSMTLPPGGFTMVTGSSGMATASVVMDKPNAVVTTKSVSIESKATVESLGQQTIEGVPAEGKRTTSVIPAGSIGNEQDIRIVNETWYSNELQTMISSTRTDPRMGTTTYRLTNIQRAEPSPDLFQVPSDYTIRDIPKSGALQMEYKTSK